MAGKYLNGSGLGHLWSTMRSTFLFIVEEMSAFGPSMKKFATLDENDPYACGNSISAMRSSSRTIVPLQSSPDFDGSAGCYIYQSSVNSSQGRYHTALYQVSSNGKLYTVPASGTPSLVTSLSGTGITSSSSGYYVVQDAVYGNWWLSNTNAAITASSFNIPTSSGNLPDPTPYDPGYTATTAEIHITGTSIDSDYALFDDYQGFWTCDTADAYIRFTDDLEFTYFHFDTATPVGESRVCNYVSDGAFNYSYNLKRTTSTSGHYITITRTRAGQIVPEI